MADPVDFKEITDGCPKGTGIFDQLMKSVKAHLKEEYDEQRIRGSEYTQVYLGSLQSAMAQAIQWQLGAQIAANQAELINEQITNANKQGYLTDAQRAQVEAQTLLTGAQRENVIAEKANIGKQGMLIEANIAATDANRELTDARTETEIVNRETAEFNKDRMLPAQEAVLLQKYKTEQAQTKDTLHNIDGTTAYNVSGALGKRNDLMKKQTDGFDRDAEQKAARTIIDTWGMAIGSDIDGTSFPGQVGTDQLDTLILGLREKSGIDR